MRLPLFLPCALLLFLAGCADVQPTPLLASPTSSATITSTPRRTFPATYTPVAKTAASRSTPTPQPMQGITPAAAQITPVVSGASVGSGIWSPDSRWLDFTDYTTRMLHFYDAVQASVCDTSTPVKPTDPDQYIIWLPNGRVVIQGANRVLAGLPCASFTSANPAEILALKHNAPSFSPEARYQVVEQIYTGSRKDVNMVMSFKEVTSGKIVSKIAFSHVPSGGGKYDGYWLDNTHFLIPYTRDQGPLLVVPGKTPIKIAPELFHLPLKPGNANYDIWQAMDAGPSPTKGPFYLRLVTSTAMASPNPSQVFNSATGQVETLPYLATQVAFSNDGHWLLVTQNDSHGQPKMLIRAINATGTAFQPFAADPDALIAFSPDGSLYRQVSADEATISLYTTQNSVFLGAWTMPGYEASPTWSPDGKYLSVWARRKSDYLEAIFIIAVPQH